MGNVAEEGSIGDGGDIIVAGGHNKEGREAFGLLGPGMGISRVGVGDVDRRGRSV